MKLAEKYVNGELTEDEETSLNEGFFFNRKQKKAKKKANKRKSGNTKIGSFISGVIRFLLWVGIVGFGAVASGAGVGAWVIGKIASIASTMTKGLQDVNSRLSESIKLECEDDMQAIEEADADELDECGNPVEDSSPAAMVH